MDFQTLALPEAGVAGINADALIVVLPATGDLPSFGGVVDAALADALKGGDLERKAGRSVYLPRLAGAKAGRVVLAVARDNSAKAFTYGGHYPGTTKDFGQADQFQQQKNCTSPLGGFAQYCSTVLR